MTKSRQIRCDKWKKKIGKLFVIAIGINEYKAETGNLNNCCTDAQSIFETFKSKEYFSMDDNSILVTSDTKNTDRQNILDSINACEKFIDESTNIIFYYSGHGCNINDTFHFWVTDSESPEQNVISINDITEILSNMNKGKYKSITILIDACQEQINHSKNLGKQSYNFLDEYIDNAKGIGVIYSCSKGEYSLDTFNEHNISVFTYLILQALNGYIEALDGNFLTFNKIYEFLQLESRKISKANTHINQHPQYFFKGTDIVYAYIPAEFIKNEKADISVCTHDEKFMTVMFDLQNIVALLYFAKSLSVECGDDANMEIPSENFIRQVCRELSNIKLLNNSWYPEILSNASTYLNLIHLNSTESLKSSVKMQTIDDVIMLYNDLDNIYNSYIDKLY